MYVNYKYMQNIFATPPPCGFSRTTVDRSTVVILLFFSTQTKISTIAYNPIGLRFKIVGVRYFIKLSFPKYLNKLTI